jgi:putative membrane protein
MTRTKLPMLLAASALALGLAACGGSEPAASNAIPEETAMDGTPAVDQGTVNFVEKAALGNMFEIEASKLALERSQVQSVKEFAQTLIDAHTASLSELTSLSSSAMVTAPTVLDSHFSDQITKLQEAKVEDFDDIYIDQQTEAHENSRDNLKSYADNGVDGGLRAFAAKTVPTVEMHLETVRALDKSDADDITPPASDS